ncbi:MAG TPA: AMP-binding protein [Streptosporangiaceae bacterium]|nr:AMP-binding protein [Streptosporangiaceae bacterium]
MMPADGDLLPGAQLRTLRDLLQLREAEQPDDVCFVFESADGHQSDLTYAQFAAGVRRLASGLTRLGVKKGDAVVVHLPNCREFMLTWFGLAWIGGIMVPSNLANTERELAHLFALAEATGFVTTSGYLGTFEATLRDLHREVFGVVTDAGQAAASSGASLSAVPFEELSGSGAAPPEPDLDETDICEFLFTSGTTSAPKAVMITHANCIRAGVRKVMSCLLGRDDRFLTALPAFHANAQATSIMVSLVAGATCVLVENYSARRFWQQIRAHRATCTSLVAMQVRTLLAQPPGPGDADHQLRCNFYAINVLDSEKEEFERRFGLRLMNGWGMSETFCAVTRTPLYGDTRWPSVGVPLHDRLVRVVDENGDDVPTGTIGEIAVGGIPGISIMKGYFRDPEATAATIRHGWLHTGDSGYLDRYGYLYFYDRIKDVIKRSGENVSALEVEAVLLTHPEVDEAAVFGVPDPIRDEAVKACVVLAAGSALGPEDLRAYCGLHLSGFKVPTIIEIRDSLPKTSIGKIEKRTLRREDTLRPEAG